MTKVRYRTSGTYKVPKRMRATSGDDAEGECNPEVQNRAQTQDFDVMIYSARSEDGQY